MTSYLRYKQELRIVQDADDIESWITVRGNHIPIKKGQSKEEAVKSFLEHQAGKNDLPQGTKWSPTNKKGEGTGNKTEPKKEKYNIKHGASIQNIENVINAHADKKAYKSWKEEEEYVAKKLKEEGIYAYGGQIKEAMKNVYGEAYPHEINREIHKIQTRMKNVGIKRGAKLQFPDGSVQEVEMTISDLVDLKKDGKIDTHTFAKLESGIKKGDIKVLPLSSNNPVAKIEAKKIDKEWEKRANKPVTLGEATKKAAQTSYSLNQKAKKEANYTALEIAYNDVAFTKSSKQNKADLLKAVSKSGAEHADYMKQIINNMPETAFESINSFRKGLKDSSKWSSSWSKRANKPQTLGSALKNTMNIIAQQKEIGKLNKKADK